MRFETDGEKPIMTQTKRIILNVFATYGRSLLVMFCGLFTSRWVLHALGTEAYGVFGVVGAIISLVTIVNGMLSASVSRYYAFAYGKASIAADKAAAEDDCCRWFNVALFVHTLLPMTFAAVGVFVGDWAIEHYFTIPDALRPTSHFVFYFTLLTVTVGMINVPFRAMFVAQQLIAELTVIDIFVPIVNVGCAWWLLSYGGDKLFFNALYTMGLSVLSAVLIAARAVFVFPACRIDFRKMWDLCRIRQLMTFAGWQFVGWIGYTCRTQGVAVIVNKMLGLQYNSTMTVAGTVTAKAATLSNSLTGAFTPAVTNAAGAGDRSMMCALALRSCKFGTLLCAVFAIPLIVEMKYVIGIWLTTIPPQTAPMCVVVMTVLFLDKMTGGALSAILATGDIRTHEIWNSLFFFVALGVAYLAVRFTQFGILGVGIGFAANAFLCMILKMTLWKTQLHFPLRPWLRFAGWFMISGAVSFLLASGIRLVMAESFVRLCVSTAICILTFSGLSYLTVLDVEERAFIVMRIVNRWRKKNA